jgi:hypothetical protein
MLFTENSFSAHSFPLERRCCELKFRCSDSCVHFAICTEWLGKGNVMYTCHSIHGSYYGRNRRLLLRQPLYKRFVVVPRETLMHYSEDLSESCNKPTHLYSVVEEGREEKITYLSNFLRKTKRCLRDEIIFDAGHTQKERTCFSQ